MDRSFSIVAIIAAHNEADVIATVVGHLVEQGVQVFLIDNASTDDTVERVRPWLGRGLLAIERFPPTDAPGAADEARWYPWEALLRRKEELAAELDADWILHHDADEIRESPWRHLDLRQAIRQVDSFGFNAIEFAVLNFRPTAETAAGDGDVRERMPFYEPRMAVGDWLQIKGWKKLPGIRVELTSSGGHEARFPGRAVFPIRFLLRHYPIRGEEHGRRKVDLERRERFLPSERARGWHSQYDDFDGRYLHDPDTLTAFDPDRDRLELFLRHRGVEELERKVDEVQRSAYLLDQELNRRARNEHELARELTASQKAFEAERGDLNRRLEQLAAELAACDAERAAATHWGAELESALQSVQSSAAWRWTAPLRRATTALRRAFGR